jgi:hypothetical protein
MWDFDKRFGASTDNLEKNTDEFPSAHNKLVFIKKKPVGRFDSRSFLSRCIWKALDGGGFVLVTSPEETQRRPPEGGVVRATYPSTLKIKPLGSDSSRLEYVIHPDAGGAAPSWAMNLVIGKSLARVIQAQEYFQAGRGLVEWMEEDGRCTGEFCLMKTKAEKHHGKGETKIEARVRAMMENHKGLKELGKKHEWFKVLLTKVVANKLRPAGNSKAKLCNMSEKDANVIGGALASCIAANLTAPAAVDEWILRYRAIGELEREYVCERRGRKKRSGSGAPTADANNRRQQRCLFNAINCASGGRAGGAGERQRPTPTSSFSCARAAHLRSLSFLLASLTPPAPASPTHAPPPGTRGSDR